MYTCESPLALFTLRLQFTKCIFSGELDGCGHLKAPFISFGQNACKKIDRNVQIPNLKYFDFVCTK